MNSALAEQNIGKTNENNIVYCSSCHSYINSSTGQKVPFGPDPTQYDPVKATNDSDLAR